MSKNQGKGKKKNRFVGSSNINSISELIINEENEIETFTKWCNYRLKDKGLEIKNLVKDFSTGILLIELVNTLSNNSFTKKYHNAPKNKGQEQENIGMILNHLKATIKLGGISSTDIVSSNTKAILLLIWNLIRFYELNGKEEELLEWMKEITKMNIDSSFGKSLSDGEILWKLVQSSVPTLEKKSEPKETIEECLRIAETIGVPRLITVDSILTGTETKLLLTYLSVMKNRFAKVNEERVFIDQSIIENEQEEPIQELEQNIVEIEIERKDEKEYKKDEEGQKEAETIEMKEEIKETNQLVETSERTQEDEQKRNEIENLKSMLKDLQNKYNGELEVRKTLENALQKENEINKSLRLELQTKAQAATEKMSFFTEKEKNLQSKEKQLAEREQQLKTKENFFSEKEQQLKEKEKNFLLKEKRWNEGTLQSEKKFLEKQTALKEEQKSTAQKEKELQAKEDSLMQKEKELNIKALEKLGEHQAMILSSEKEQQYQQKIQTLENKINEITKETSKQELLLKSELAKKDELIDQLKLTDTSVPSSSCAQCQARITKIQELEKQLYRLSSFSTSSVLQPTFKKSKRHSISIQSEIRKVPETESQKYRSYTFYE